jgi:hypothetical protein
MHPSPLLRGPVRPAAVVNEEIRALVRGAGCSAMYGETRDRYRELVAEWTIATAAERACGQIVEAA